LPDGGGCRGRWKGVTARETSIVAQINIYHVLNDVINIANTPETAEKA